MDGLFLHYVDRSKDSYVIESLEQLISERQDFLEWDFENETLDEIDTGNVIYNRQGKNALSTDHWQHRRVINRNNKYEETTNKG